MMVLIGITITVVHSNIVLILPSSKRPPGSADLRCKVCKSFGRRGLAAQTDNFAERNASRDFKLIFSPGAWLPVVVSVPGDYVSRRLCLFRHVSMCPCIPCVNCLPIFIAPKLWHVKRNRPPPSHSRWRSHDVSAEHVIRGHHDGKNYARFWQLLEHS